MQVLRQTRYTEMSSRNRTRLVRIPSARGRIYDREGRLLVDNKAATQLAVVVDEVENKEDLAGELSNLTKMSPSYILKKIKEYMFKPFLPAVLASDMSAETLTGVAEARWHLPGVSIQVVPIRDYLMGEDCSHLIGYVGAVGERELGSGYTCGDIVGRIGIERQFDKVLRGENGCKEIQVDHRGNIDAVLNIVEPKIGKSIFLTIDLLLQEELYDAMKERNGAGIVMDTDTGEILALVSSPGFDPNLLVSPVKEETIANLFRDKRRPMVDRAISGLYPPGSVFKVIVALAALEKGVINKKNLFFCDGEFQLGDTVFKCWEKKGHGWVDLTNALKKSCNEYFYQVGLKTGSDAIVNMAGRFGFGKITGIEAPGEKPGLIPLNKTNWSLGDTVNLSIGQGKILTTPIQIACFISAVANGGTLYKPKLLLEEETIGTATDVEKEYLDTIKDGLHRVVNEPDGTGHMAHTPGVDISAKTGTVALKEKNKKRDICWFAGFGTTEDTEKNDLQTANDGQLAANTPAGRRTIAVSIVIEQGESGGVTAGPIAQRIFKKWKEIEEQKNVNEISHPTNAVN